MTKTKRMKLLYVLSIISIISIVGIISIIGTACTTNPANTPLQQAQVRYDQASVAYQAAQSVITTARANHQITDAQWAVFDSVQTTVSTTAPTVRRLLDTWSRTGTKPDGIDAALALLESASTAATSIQKGVKP